MVSPPSRLLEAGARPARLSDLPRPPLALHLHGQLPVGPAVAIVGTRWPTEGGAAFARELAGELAAAGVVVLSGGARGIDAAAHRGALDVGGMTVVVAPSGLARPYPPEHSALFLEILAAGGGHLSVAHPEERAALPRFHQRNEVMAALAHIVVVGEAPLRSGARHTARIARRLGRPVFAVPGAPWNERALGALEELRLGARPLIRPRDVLGWLAEQRLHAIGLPGAPLLVRRAPRLGAPVGDRSSSPELMPDAGEVAAAPGAPRLLAHPAAPRDHAVGSPPGGEGTPSFALTPPPVGTGVASRRRRARP